jgi:phosphoglycerol transferase MdoB-like AlkP superfamily enzyme
MSEPNINMLVFLEKIDNGFDNVLNYEIVYSILLIIFIVVLTFPDILDMFNDMLPETFKITNILPKILFILCILYFSRKDLRIAIFSTLILLLMIEKQNIRELNNKIVNLLKTDIVHEEQINQLKNKIK